MDQEVYHVKLSDIKRPRVIGSNSTEIILSKAELKQTNIKT